MWLDEVLLHAKELIRSWGKKLSASMALEKPRADRGVGSCIIKSIKKKLNIKLLDGVVDMLMSNHRKYPYQHLWLARYFFENLGGQVRYISNSSS